MNDHIVVKWKDYNTMILGKITDIKCNEKYITIKWANHEVYKGKIVVEIDKLESITFKQKEVVEWTPKDAKEILEVITNGKLY